MPYPPSSSDQKNSSNKRLYWRYSREKNGALSLPRRASLQRLAFDTSPTVHLRIRLPLLTRLLLPGFRDNILRPRSLPRSEEHTSELQSHSFISYAVFCLKKTTPRGYTRFT